MSPLDLSGWLTGNCGSSLFGAINLNMKEKEKKNPVQITDQSWLS